MALVNYKDLADEKRKQWDGSLFARYDQDRDFLYLKPYTMVDLNKKPVAGVLHTTLNDPAMFVAWIKAEMFDSEEQWEATGEKLDDDLTSKLEDVARHLFTANNKRLRKSGIWELEAFIDEQGVIRGRAAARCLTWMENKKVINEMLPCDARRLVFDSDSSGLLWVAPEYQRTKAMIAKTYPNYAWTKKDNEQVKLTDIWFMDNGLAWNEIWIEDNKVKEATLFKIDGEPLDYIPYVIQTVQMGSSLYEDDYEKRQGESIFWMVRDIIPLMNEISSILRSINFKAYAGHFTLDQDLGEAPEPPKPDGVTLIDKGSKGYTLVQMQDMQSATMNLWAIVDQRWQAATRSRIEEGTLNFTLSAIAINDMKAERDTLILPRLRNRALMKLGLFDMAMKQLKSFGSVEIDGRTLDMKEFDIDYQMSINYDTTKPRDKAAAVALMNAWGDQLSLESKLRNIAKVKDVGKELRLLARQKAETAEPGVAFLELAHDYVDMAEDAPKDQKERYYIIAKMMAIKGAAFYKRLGEPPVVEAPQPAPQAGSILPPLIGGKG